MADISMGRIAKRGLAGTFDPRGRDDRLQFWLYFAMVFAPMIFVQFAAQMALTFPSIELGAMANSQAEARAAQLQQFKDMADGIVAIGYVNVVLHLVAVLLMLAAAARRLHDRGHSGWWSLIMPVAAVASGLDQARRAEAMMTQMPRIMRDLKPEEFFDFPFKLQAAMPGPSWPAIVAGALMLWLAIELLRAGTPGDNRFGPQP
jgi:uncharacterized membrane protein YhaH (DUF805 family)